MCLKPLETVLERISKKISDFFKKIHKIHLISRPGYIKIGYHRYMLLATWVMVMVVVVVSVSVFF